MCDNVIIHSHRDNFPDRICENQGDLANIIGRENMIFDKDYNAELWRPQDCLCPIDLKQSAEKSGYECNRLDNDGEYDAFDFHWRKNDPTR